MLHSVSSCNKKNSGKYLGSKYILLTCYCMLSSCSSTNTDYENPGVAPAPQPSPVANRSILPPSGQGPSTSKKDKNQIDKLMEEMPDQVKNSSSEIIISVDDAGIKDSQRFKSIEEQKRAQNLARRTDNEIIGAKNLIDERHAKELGAIDKDLNLTTQENVESSPSYILALQHIKELYGEKEFERALIESNETLRFYPKSAKLLTMKGTLHQKLGNFDLALAAYEYAFELTPSKKLEAQIKSLKKLINEQVVLSRKENRLKIPGDKEPSTKKGDPKDAQ